MVLHKILLVTRDPGAFKDWEGPLGEAGCSLDVAISGDEALRRAKEGAPRLILVGDIGMPQPVFVELLKKAPEAAHVPAIMLSPGDTPASVLPRVRESLVPAKVLIAEDDRQMSAILKAVLDQSGFSVRMTHDGAETLREIKAWRPQVLVLDIMLPVIDGFHICQTMNEDHSFDPRPRVLIISGRDSDWDQNLGAACGAEGYLVKPLDNREFLKRVQGLAVR